MGLNRLPLDAPGVEEEFERIEVRRSTRRKKTISAEVVGDALIVSVPERMSRADEQKWVARMADRMSERRKKERLNEDGALVRRAAELAELYLGEVGPYEITWGGTLRTRWGWCDPERRSIELSLAIAGYPAWVRDYVILHELAHLLVPDHSRRFWRLVERYPLTERARGFLIAKGMEES
jgi:predicted metal-dependent hydrolase